MQSSYKTSRSWARHVPYSRPVYPDSFVSRLKYLFWRFETPFHPRVRDALISLDIIRYRGRQPFLLGHIVPHLSPRSFVRHLVDLGYGNHFVAWHDSDEIVSLRMPDGFSKQYHLRIFADGSVHGHYEYTPEAHPFLHLNQIGFENRSDFFLSQFGDLLVPATAEALATTTARYYMYWQPPSRAGKLELAKRLKTASVA